MKNRTGFVSNSSSSSFLVIVREPYTVIPALKSHVFVGSSKSGTHQFDWGPETHYDEGSKMLFAYMQTQYRMEVNKKEGERWLDMLNKVIREELKVDRVKWHLHMDYDLGEEDTAYIDHQSNAAASANMDLFADEQTLKYFLFNPGSRIVEDNDNH
jgi:hypothetical protein